MSSNLSLSLPVPTALCADGAAVRMAGTQDAPLFCLADVCRVLGIVNVPQAAARLDEDEKFTISLTDGEGKPHVNWFVTEAGLYTILLRSDKPAAKPFRRWICHDVLPCIRKHGAYPAPAAQPLPCEPLQVVQGFLDTCQRILSLGDGLEPRDAILLKDFARTRLGVSASEAGGATRFVVLPERCMELGFPRPKRGEDSEIGKAVAARYRRQNGREPSKHQQFVDGRTVMVNCYTTDDLEVVDAGIRDYHEAKRLADARRN